MSSHIYMLIFFFPTLCSHEHLFSACMSWQFVKFGQQMGNFLISNTRKLNVMGQKLENTPSLCRGTEINLQGTVDIDSLSSRTTGWLPPAALLARRIWLLRRTHYFITIFRGPVCWAALKCQHGYVTATGSAGKIPSSPRLIVIPFESCGSPRFFPWQNAAHLWWRTAIVAA